MRLHIKAYSRGSSAAKDLSPLRDPKSRRPSISRSAKRRAKDPKDTLIRKTTHPKDDAPRVAQMEEMDKMRSFIVRIEGVLNEMKDLVQKKEKSISSKSSIYSAKTELSKDRCSKDSKQRSVKQVHRRNLFFGHQDNRKSDRIDQRNTAPATTLSGRMHPSPNSLSQKPPNNFKQYIKDCFVNKIKDQQINLQVLHLKPKLPKPAAAENKPPAASQGLQKKQTADDTIEFLTPSHSSKLRPRATHLTHDSNNERLDSLVYTVSKSKQRQVSNFRPTKDAANSHQISGFD